MSGLIRGHRLVDSADAHDPNGIRAKPTTVVPAGSTKQAGLPDWDQPLAMPRTDGRLPELAAAAVLISLGDSWLERHPDAKAASLDAVRAALARLFPSADELDLDRIDAFKRRREFAARAVFRLWLRQQDDPETWEQALLASGDIRVAALLGRLAVAHRSDLGARWWSLQEAAIRWSALVMLRAWPDDPPQIHARWCSWAERFLGLPVAWHGPPAPPLDLVATWERLKRLERRRQRAIAASGKLRLARAPEGLDMGFLQAFFGWALADEPPPGADEAEARCTVLEALWRYERALARAHFGDEDRYRLTHPFGHRIVAAMARCVATAPREDAFRLRASLLDREPANEAVIDWFFTCWFWLLLRGCDAALFMARWKDLVEHVLEASWATNERGFGEQAIMRSALGFGREYELEAMPDIGAQVGTMRPLYRLWAVRHLHRDEENTTRLADFLISPVGEALRIDGMQWLARALAGNDAGQRRNLSPGTGEAVLHLLGTILQDHADELKQPGPRDAMLSLAASLASAGIDGALVLQDRIIRALA